MAETDTDWIAQHGEIMRLIAGVPASEMLQHLEYRQVWSAAERIMFAGFRKDELLLAAQDEKLQALMRSVGSRGL